MIDLSTEYLGLKLKNPLVPSSSPLSKQLDSALRLEDAGAAALVLHSLYEEELIAEDAMADRFLLHADLHDGESAGFLPDHGSYESAIDRYLEHLRRVKARVGIPVIASLNGVTPSGWVDLGREMEAAGADWQLVVYGRAGHGFTNYELPQVPRGGLFYEPDADRRSWAPVWCASDSPEHLL